MVAKGVHFISGIYGVGKSTLSERISRILNIPVYSASDLIKRKTGENFNTNKYVNDMDYNQHILIDAVNFLLEKENPLILTGHFCILNKTGGIDELPEFVYRNLNISKIILLEAETTRITDNLNSRDNRYYNNELIKKLQKNERQYATYISGLIGAPIFIHKMNYSDDDVNTVVDFINI